MADQDSLGSENAVNIALAIQRLGRDAYGVTIRREIAACTGRNMSIAILYSQLARLERDGMVRAREGNPTPERLGRPKRLYKLTGKGQRALTSALSGFDRLRAPLLAPAFEPLRSGMRRAWPVVLALLICVGWARLSFAFGGDGGGDGAGDNGSGGGIASATALLLFAVFGTFVAATSPWLMTKIWRRAANAQHEASHWGIRQKSNQTPSAPYLLDAICGFLMPAKKRPAILGDLLEFYRADCDEWKERYGRWLGSFIACIYYVRNAIEAALSCYFQLVLEVIKAWRKGA